MMKTTCFNASKLWLLIVLVSAMGFVSCDNPILAKVQAAVKSGSIPAISPPGGSYQNSHTVTLSCTNSKASIYYTIDGSDPTTSPTAVAYSEPVKLFYDCTLKTAARDDRGWSPGSEAEFSFTYKDVLDPTFNLAQHSGVVRTEGITGEYSISRWFSAALQSDGKIVVTGCANKANPLDPAAEYFSYICVARFSGSGELDASFGQNGFFIMENADYNYCEGRSIAVDNLDRIYVQGIVSNDSTWEIGPFFGVLGRLTSNGTIDTTYGEQGHGGYQTSESLDYYPNVSSRSLAIDPASGTAFFAFTNAVYKLNASGILDTTFGNSIGMNGIITTKYLDELKAGSGGILLGLGNIASIVRTNAGNILAAMYKSGSSLIVAEVTPEGAPSDWYIEPPAFGGLVGRRPHDLVSFPDGSILVLGRGTLNANRTPIDTAFTLWKFPYATSSPIAGWGQTAGSGTTLEYDYSNASPLSVAVLTDGSIVAGGRTVVVGGDDAPKYWTLARLGTDGIPLSYTVDQANFRTGSIYFILPLSDGKYLAVGSSNGGGTIARYWP